MFRGVSSAQVRELVSPVRVGGPTALAGNVLDDQCDFGCRYGSGSTPGNHWTGSLNLLVGGMKARVPEWRIRS
jgi:hypothetical protein